MPSGGAPSLAAMCRTHDAALNEIRAITKRRCNSLDRSSDIGPRRVRHGPRRRVLANCPRVHRSAGKNARPGRYRVAGTPRRNAPGKQSSRARHREAQKLRPQADYIPLLLGGLAMPIESSFSVITDPSGSVHYSHSLFQRRDGIRPSKDVRQTINQRDLGGRRIRYDTYTGNVDADCLPKLRKSSRPRRPSWLPISKTATA